MLATLKPFKYVAVQTLHVTSLTSVTSLLQIHLPKAQRYARAPLPPSIHPVLGVGDASPTARSVDTALGTCRRHHHRYWGQEPHGLYKLSLHCRVREVQHGPEKLYMMNLVSIIARGFDHARYAPWLHVVLSRCVDLFLSSNLSHRHARWKVPQVRSQWSYEMVRDGKRQTLLW